MGYFYFDETIQDRGGFILGAFVYSGVDMTPPVFQALKLVGLRPGEDEFKSSVRMSERPEQIAARTQLRGLFQKLGVGLVVVPNTERRALGNEAIECLKKILVANGLNDQPHQVFLDNGVVVSRAILDDLRAGVGAFCDVRVNQDSKLVGGLQVADLAAHTMGIMLLERQGHVKKLVKAGKNSGYDPDLDIDLGFELWASLRYSLFKAPQPIPSPEDPLGDLMFDVKNYGLHIASTCDVSLHGAAMERFGECYLGCIH